MVITVGYYFLPLNDGELRDEEAIVIATPWAMASCICCEPTPLIGVQGVTDMVTYGPLIL